MLAPSFVYEWHMYVSIVTVATGEQEFDPYLSTQYNRCIIVQRAEVGFAGQDTRECKRHSTWSTSGCTWHKSTWQCTTRTPCPECLNSRYCSANSSQLYVLTLKSDKSWLQCRDNNLLSRNYRYRTELQRSVILSSWYIVWVTPKRAYFYYR